MAQQTFCPDPGRLRSLIDNHLSDDEQAELVGHLDSCECCQHNLEELATGGTSWCTGLKHADREQPAPQSAFWPALNALAKDATSHEIPKPTPASPHDTIDSGRFDLDGEEEEGPPALDFLHPAEAPDTVGRLGHFHITGVLGRGGMGLVLKALDQCLQRQVAIKVLDPKLAKNKTAHERFCREARAAARVTHDNIVAVYEVEHDEEKDLPYLVMQYVAGESLQERLDRVRGPLPPQDVVRIGVQTAAGLAAAHAQGLIHRDIKPANILLETGTDKVKLTDFGLARAAEDARLTRTGFIAGTPLYMAPEQAKGEDLDHRTDLFSLGSVLYALAAGKPPFDANTPFLVLRRVTDETPRPLRDLNSQLPDGVAAIIDRLLAKNPADRFQSAAEVAEALAQYLAPRQTGSIVANLPLSRTSNPNGQPVAAPRRSRWRSEWALGALAAVLLVGLLAAGQVSGLLHILPGSGAAVDGSRATLVGNAGPVQSVAFSPDSNLLAMATYDGSLKFWDSGAGRVTLTNNQAHKGPIWSASFCRSGTHLFTASEDGTIKKWAVADGSEVKVFNEGSVRALDISCNSRLMATGGGDGRVRILDVNSGEEKAKTKGHSKIISAVAFSPDGRTVASAGADKLVLLWDATTGSEKLSLPGHTGAVSGLAFSPDGKTVASCAADHTVRLWDVDTGTCTAVLEGHAGDVYGVAFSPDGRTLASSSLDTTVKVWDVARKRLLTTLHGHTGSVRAVAYSPDGKTIASGSRDGTVKLWDAPTAP